MGVRRGFHGAAGAGALALSCALIAACTESAAPVITPTPTESNGEVASTGTAADAVQPWRAGPVPGVDAQGPTYPTAWPASRVVGSGPTTSLSPILAVPAEAGLKGRVQVEVVDVSGGGGFGGDGSGTATGRVWEGTAPADRIELPAAKPVLRQGATYGWRARAGSGPWLGPFFISVDTVRQANAAVDEIGGLTVNVISGVPTAAWSTPAFEGAGTSLRLQVTYRPGSPETPGLPAGWTWVLPGTGPVALTTSGGAEPRSVTLLNADGSGSTFVRTAVGAYVPGLSDGTPIGLASGGVLAQLNATTWRFTAPSGVMTILSDGRAVGEWAGGVPVASLTWDSEGRLTEVGDGIAGGRTMSLSYGNGCEAGTWGHGFTAPSDLWCSVSYPDGTASQVGYVDAGGAPRIALIADPGGTGVGLGWDAAGRLSGLRPPAATAAAATAGQAWSGSDLTTQITYDAQGRVASVTTGAAEPGGDRVRRTYQYPTAATSAGLLEATVREEFVTGGSVQPVASRLGGGAVLKVQVTSDRWQVTRRVGADGLTTNLTYDPETGEVRRGTNANGRTVTVESNAVGATATVGPFLGGSARAPRTERTLDATIVDPANGAASRIQPWTGLAAIAWPNSDPTGGGAPQWWNAGVLKDGLAATFTTSPAGSPGPWTAQATGLWKVAAKGDYSISVSTSAGTSVDLLVDGVRCGGAQSPGRCTLPLAAGEHFVALAITAGAADGAASFEVRAARDGGASQRIALADLRPNYQVATRTRINDNVGSTEYGWQVLTYPRPWATGAESLTLPGGRTWAYAYEPLDIAAGKFGRLIKETTPGGQVQTTSYYGVGETAADPCTGTTYDQSGRLRAITRYDGVTLNSVYNDAGLVVAETLTGAGASEVSCATYDAAGRVTSTRTTGIGGQLVEQSTVTRTWQDGRLTIVARTELGPGAVVGSGTKVSTTVVLDAAGRKVEYTDEVGTRTAFTYQPDGTLIRRATTAPGATAPTLTVDLSYDAQTGWLTGVAANGATLATMSYDNLGQMARITYPGGVTADTAYDTVGAPQQVRLAARDRVFTHTLSRNSGGRSLSSSLAVTDPAGETITKHTWKYTYDGAGRISGADLDVRGDKTGTGGARSFGYTYGKSPQGCAAGAGADLNRTGGTRDGVSFETCHDGAGRLTWTTDPHVAGGPGRATATYDALGRMTSLTPATGDTDLTFDWATGIQPRRISDSGSVTELLVVDGRILGRTQTDAQGSTTTRYGYVGGGAPVLLLDANDRVLDVRVGLPGGAVAHIATEASLAVDHFDLNGSALTTTLADGTSQPSAESTGATATGLAPRLGPYGEPLEEEQEPTGPTTGIGAGTNFGFQGIARNPTIAGHHDLTVSARPYHPWLGQFVAFDPVIGASTTGYGYGDGTPVDSPDFSGGTSVLEVLGYVGAGIGALLTGYGLGKVLKKAKAWEYGTKIATGVVLAGAVGTLGYFAYTAWTQGGSMQDRVYLTVAAAAMAVGALAGYARTKRVKPIPEASVSGDSFISNPPDYLEESVGDIIGKKYDKVRQSRGSSVDSSLRKQSIGSQRQSLGLGSQSGSSQSYDPLQQSFVNVERQKYGTSIYEVDE